MYRFFETIQYRDGVFYNLDSHQKRIARTFANFYTNDTPHDLQSLLRFDGEGLFRCRFSYDAKGYAIEYLPYRLRTIERFYIVDSDLHYSFKYTDRDALNNLKKGLGENEEVLIFKDGLLSDTTFSNVAILINDEWLTPKKPLLEGCMLSTLDIKRADISREMVFRSQKIALINSMLGFYEIASCVIFE